MKWCIAVLFVLSGAACANETTMAGDGEGAPDSPVDVDGREEEVEDGPVDQPCPAGTTYCSGVCVDISSDHANCGGCGIECESAQVCSNGRCVLECPAGETDCSGQCTDLDSDYLNCGSCGHACGTDQVCRAGACATECGPDLTDCDGSCVDLTTNRNHCGACSSPCDVTEQCQDSRCCLPCYFECCSHDQTCIGMGGLGGCCDNDKVCGSLCCGENLKCIGDRCCIDITSPLGIVGDFRFEADFNCADENTGHGIWDCLGWRAVGPDHTSGSVSGLPDGDAYQADSRCNRYNVQLAGAGGESITIEFDWSGSSGSNIYFYFRTSPSNQECSTTAGNVTNLQIYRL
jgi:hypothetical protein